MQSRQRRSALRRRLEEDPRSFCYDYSSSEGGKISLHYIVRGVRLFVEIKFDLRAVLAAGKGEDLKMMEGILERIEDSDKRANYEKAYPEAAPLWTCKCGVVNTGNFCCECGCKRL